MITISLKCIITMDMATYMERLQLYFECNGAEEAKKVSVMLTVIGNSTIHNLVAPAKPKDKTFDVSCWIFF